MAKILIIAAPEICKGDLLSRVDRLCFFGADKILLRAKYLSEDHFYELAKEVSFICQSHGREFIINHFFKVACELESSFWMTSKQAAAQNLNFNLIKSLNKKAKIYAPAHDLEQAKLTDNIADIFIASHIFQTACKADQTPNGLNLIRKLKANFIQEIYALGGINELNFKLALSAGASGICTMSEAMSCEDEEKFIKNFRF